MKQKILNDLKNAMKNQNKELLSVVRMVKGAIQMEEIKVKHELSDDEVIGIIAREIKTRKESIKEFEKGNRTDLIEQTKNSMSKYMNELQSGVDSAWRGASADKFKENMLTLANQMSATLDVYYDNLEQEMATIVNKMADAEESLVGKAGN